MFSEQYERLSLLGEGAFGSAYLVRPKASPRLRYVAKEIRISHLDDKQREGALAESEVLKMMKHCNIIAYIDSYLEGPRMYIIMEYADGGDLAEKIKERKEEEAHFAERDIMFIFVQVASALQHIHCRKVLHRDLKPLNIFLTRDGTVKLGDFGIAKVIDSTTAGAQTTIGSPFYLSPEMCNSEAYGVKSDLWSLGVVTYELAMLRVPFWGSNLPAVALKIISVDPEPLPETYHPDLVKMVAGFLDKEPSNRPELDDVLNDPFVRGYADLHRAHCSEWGTGGCEAMVRSVRDAKAAAATASAAARAGTARGEQDLDSTLDTAAAVLASAVGPRESGAPSSRASSQWPRQKQDGSNNYRRRGSLEDLQHGHAAGASRRSSSGASGGGGSSQSPKRGGAGGPIRRSGSRPLEAPGRSAEDVRSWEAQEFLRNKQAAAETKRRNEMQQQVVAAVPWERGPVGAEAAPPQQRRRWSAESSANADPERHKEEVRRRAQEEKDEAVAARHRELKRAMEEQQEAMRLARERQHLQRVEEHDGDDEAAPNHAQPDARPGAQHQQHRVTPPQHEGEEDASLCFSDTLPSEALRDSTGGVGSDAQLRQERLGQHDPAERPAAGEQRVHTNGSLDDAADEGSPGEGEDLDNGFAGGGGGILVFDMSSKAARKPQLSSGSQPLQRKARAGAKSPPGQRGTSAGGGSSGSRNAAPRGSAGGGPHSTSTVPERRVTGPLPRKERSPTARHRTVPALFNDDAAAAPGANASNGKELQPPRNRALAKAGEAVVDGSLTPPACSPRLRSPDDAASPMRQQGREVAAATPARQRPRTAERSPSNGSSAAVASALGRPPRLPTTRVCGPPANWMRGDRAGAAQQVDVDVGEPRRCPSPPGSSAARAGAGAAAKGSGVSGAAPPPAGAADCGNGCDGRFGYCMETGVDFGGTLKLDDPFAAHAVVTCGAAAIAELEAAAEAAPPESQGAACKPCRWSRGANAQQR